MGRLAVLAAALLAVGVGVNGCGGGTAFDGVTLNLASQNDQFAAVLAALAPEFEADRRRGQCRHPELPRAPDQDHRRLCRPHQGLRPRDRRHRLVRPVRGGRLYRRSHRLDQARRGRDQGRRHLSLAHGFARRLQGQAGRLPVRRLRQCARLPQGPLRSRRASSRRRRWRSWSPTRIKLTDKSKKIYGFVANGQKGPAVAQDWMQYNRQFGGSILDKDGKPALNSPANIASVVAYKKLFDEAAPPGAADYDWGGREESFRQGLVANMQTWSIGAADYDNPKMSKIAGKAGIMLTPPGEGPAAGTTASAAGRSASTRTSTRRSRKPPGRSSNGSRARRCTRSSTCAAPAAICARAR